MILSPNQISRINQMVREFGAANLEVACRENKSSLTVGFRIWRPDSDKYDMHSCFSIPFDEKPNPTEIAKEIERHLDACLLNPEIEDDL